MDIKYIALVKMAIICEVKVLATFWLSPSFVYLVYVLRHCCRIQLAFVAISAFIHLDKSPSHG